MWESYTQHRNPEKHTVVGDLRIQRSVHSPQLGNERDILVLLPPSYGEGSRRYSVLYMHDGQNLFDATTSFAGEWQVDETMHRLKDEGIEAIVIGIPNAGANRSLEYIPFDKPSYLRGGNGDLYLDFVVNTLKPMIDSDFRTLPDQANTGVMGSSLGGLISLYALFRHADVFGMAGVVSPALMVGGSEIFPFIEKSPYVDGKIYMDVGSWEITSGAGTDQAKWAGYYKSTVDRMAGILEKKGYQRGRNFLYVYDEGGRHHEADWARRLPDALRFLLK